MQITSYRNQNMIGFSGFSDKKRFLAKLPYTFVSLMDDAMNIVEKKGIRVSDVGITCIGDFNQRFLNTKVLRKLGNGDFITGAATNSIIIDRSNYDPKGVANFLIKNIAEARNKFKKNFKELVKSVYPTNKARKAARLERIASRQAEKAAYNKTVNNKIKNMLNDINCF